MQEGLTHSVQPKVVVLTSRFPYPLDKGDKLRIYNHIIELSKSTRITLICLHENQLKQEDISAIAPFCEEIHSFQLSKNKRTLGALKLFLSGKPMQIGFFYNSHIKRRITGILKELEPDHVHCHMVRMGCYVSFDQDASYSIDYMDSMVLNDMASQHIRGWGLNWLRFLERKRIAQFEKKIHGKFDTHFIISQRDKNNMSPFIQKDIVILSNGVHLDSHSTEQVSQKRYDLCFCGNLGYVPNQKAIEIILNDIRPELSSLKYIIAGAEATSELKKNENEGLKINSPVSAMSDIYKESRILIAPIFTGSGQQNKILEAMALGVPCITTSFVNESIGANNGAEIILADDPKGFIESVKVLLSRPELYAEISKNGRLLVERRFNWSTNTMPLITAILNRRTDESHTA